MSQSVTVFCGTSCGADEAYQQHAYELGKRLAKQGYGVVYGGASVGLMGAVARGCLSVGGRVTGVIPDFLIQREKPTLPVTELIVTTSMHQRKSIMWSRAAAFIILPGGIGTLEELVEQLTWRQLGQHRKPIVLLSSKGYWAGLQSLFDQMQREGFLINDAMPLYHVVETVDDAIETTLKALQEDQASCEHSMTNFTHDVAFYDANGSIVRQFSTTNPDKKIIVFFGQEAETNFDQYSYGRHPATASDTLQSAIAAKEDFLSKAPTLAFVIQDLSGLEMLVSAVRRIHSGTNQNVRVLSKVPTEPLEQMLLSSLGEEVEAVPPTCRRIKVYEMADEDKFRNDVTALTNNEKN